MDPRPLFSFLIINYNGKALISECVNSIYKQKLNDFEVVIIDNNSADESATFIQQQYPHVKLIKSKSNLGFAGGNNLGFKHCIGKYIFMLNNDVYLPTNTLGEINKAIHENPDINIFSSFLINYHKRTLVDSAGDTIYSVGTNFCFAKYPTNCFKENRLITSACAGAAIFKKESLDKIGYFDEDFFLNMEDMDLCFRAQHLGEKILFVHAAKVFHKGSVTLGGKLSSTSIYYSERNYLWFLLKNIPLFFLVKMLPFLIVIKCIRIINYSRKGLLIPALKGNWDSLKLIPKMLRKRKKILGYSKLSSDEFSKLLRKNWLIEKVKFKFKNYNVDI